MTNISPNWHPDPFGRYELRYWDGQEWSEHVATGGRQGIDPPVASLPTQLPNHVDDEICRHARDNRLGSTSEERQTLFSEEVLLIRQKPKVFEVKAEYAIFSNSGRPLAAVREIGQSVAKRAFGGATYYRNTTHRLEVVDEHGKVLIRLNRPAKFQRSKMLVTDGSGGQLGAIKQKTLDMAAVAGTRVHFSLQPKGLAEGRITADSISASDCSVQDASGDEIAVIERRWAAKSIFTKADNYVLRMQKPLNEPLHSLVIASVFAVDLALRQGNLASRPQ